jgi:hypothetical protein
VHISHSGKRLSASMTTYTALFFILALTGGVLLFAGNLVRAATITDSHDITVSGRQRGPAPSVAAVIASPADGLSQSGSGLTVSGLCQTGYIVELYRNETFAGSSQCSPGGSFSLDITLVAGVNTLVARTTDGEDQYGPDSLGLHVTYNEPVIPGVPATGSEVPGTTTRVLPFLLQAPPLQEGVFAGDAMTLSYEIRGGTAPYAVSIDWQDGSDPDIVAVTAEGSLTAHHIYADSGQYRIKLTAKDRYGRQAVIETLAYINTRSASAPGPLLQAICGTKADGTPSTSNDCVTSGFAQRLGNILWPAFGIACLMTLCFWLGEKVMARSLKHS